MKVLRDKVAVVTGGARGIGRDMAYCFAENGANVVLVDLLEDEMRTTAEGIKERGQETLCLRRDVREREQMLEASKLALEKFGRVHVLLTSAGVGQDKPSLALTSKDWEDMIDTNLNGTFYACQAFGAHMCEEKRGNIVLIGSKSGLIVNKTAVHSHYNASKAGVIHLAKCLGAEWAPYGVHVNCISPGYILTPMTQERVEEHPKWIPGVPLGRLGKPEDLRGAVMLLATSASDFMTGANIVIDGGYTIW